LKGLRHDKPVTAQMVEGALNSPLYADLSGDAWSVSEFFPPKTEGMETTLESVATLEPLCRALSQDPWCRGFNPRTHTCNSGAYRLKPHPQ
jgi:hypothetical protein